MNYTLENIKKQLQDNTECSHYYIRKWENEMSNNCCPSSLFCNFLIGIICFLLCQVHYFCNPWWHFKYQLTFLTKITPLKKIQAYWYPKAWFFMLFSPYFHLCLVFFNITQNNIWGGSNLASFYLYKQLWKAKETPLANKLSL